MAKNVVIRSKLEGAAKTKRGLKGIDSGLKSLGRSAINVGAAYFGARGLISGLKMAVEAAGQQELAEKKLEAALGSTSQTLLDYASSLQSVTTFGDEATIEAMSMMAAFTKDEEALKKLTAVTLDYAAATGTDLNAAAQLVGRTFGTSMNAMSRYGVTVEGAAGSTERLESLTGNLAKMFGGQAAAQAETMTGQITQMKNVLGDTAELIGAALSPSLVKFAKQTKEVAEFWIEFMSAGKGANDTFKEFADETTTKMDNKIQQLNSSITYQTELLMDLGEGTKHQEMLEKRAITQGRTVLEQQMFEMENTREMMELRDEVMEQKEGYLQQLDSESLKNLEIDLSLRQINDTAGLVGVSMMELAPAIENAFDDTPVVSFGEAFLAISSASAETIAGLATDLQTASKAYKGFSLMAKRMAQVQAIQDTYAAATAAYKSAATIPVIGWILAPIAAAAAVAAGLANVQMIENAKFAEGGDFITAGKRLIMVGDNPGGKERVQITPLSSPNISGTQPGLTLNISAPLVDETVIDTIIPAIEKAQRLNLA